MEQDHEHDYESPFLDRDMPLFQPEDEAMPPSAEAGESPFAQPFVHGETEEESPFLAGETNGHTPFLSGEAPDESEWEGARQRDPSLFDPAELEQEQRRWAMSSDEADEAEAPGAALFGEMEGERGVAWEASDSEGEDGEIVFTGEAEESGGEGEVVFLAPQREGMESAESPESEGESLPTMPKTRVLGRILWPALGFPAVIAPKAGSRQGASVARSATRCITALVLSDRPSLSKEEAARYLRIVPWSKVGKRHIPAGQPGAFREEDLIVRNDAPSGQLSIPEPRGKHENLVKFGEEKDGYGMIVGTLSEDVRELYRSWGLKHLHEIRVSEEASARLAPGQYHLFWNNESPREDAPSDEMALLLQRFAKPRRQKEGARWAQVLPNLMREYEFEYGPLHFPYSKEGRPQKRAEILHPVFVQAESQEPLRISHVTDLHVDVRMDVYEFNLGKEAATLQQRHKLPVPPQFNNWNRAVAKVYERAREQADIILMTGDLIDYGRGHMGVAGAKKLADNGMYHRDRNWFLFRDLMAAQGRYTVPVYMSLGNHDWRLNPYPPFAIAGAPSVPTMVHNYTRFDDDQRTAILRAAHGPGYGELAAYDPRWKGLDVAGFFRILPVTVQSTIGLNRPGLPTETTVDSVIWYLLTLNPFFDYAWSMPSGQRMLMLDWASDEAVLFPLVQNGKEFTVKVSKGDFKRAANPGPMAARALTAAQKVLVQGLLQDPSKAKVVGIHMPPIGPYDDWSDAELAAGVKTYANPRTGRGPVNFGKRVGGRVTPMNGHPLFAIRPKETAQLPNAAGMTADYNSFLQNREWFIREMAKPRHGVRVVLSGHIHRNDLLAVRIGTKKDGAAVDGQYLVYSVQPSEVRNVNGDALAPGRAEVHDLRAPLYLNTTSAGPRGNRLSVAGKWENVAPGYSRVVLAADGRIVGVAFDDIDSTARPVIAAGTPRGAPVALREAAMFEASMW